MRSRVRYPQVPSNVTLDEASTVPLALATGALALYDSKHPPRGGFALTPPWGADGREKYAGEPIIIVGGARSVGQFGKDHTTLTSRSQLNYIFYKPSSLLDYPASRPSSPRRRSTTRRISSLSVRPTSSTALSPCPTFGYRRAAGSICVRRCLDPRDAKCSLRSARARRKPHRRPAMRDRRGETGERREVRSAGVWRRAEPTVASVRHGDVRACDGVARDGGHQGTLTRLAGRKPASPDW